MGLCKSAPAIICLLSLAMVQVSLAQDSQQDYLDPHNSARAQVGVGPLAWDDTVAAYAQDYAKQMAGTCNHVHSHGRYGENLAWSDYGSLTVAEAVKLWVDEKQYYDHNSNSCAPGETCGHYTQVVWRKSNHLGCARVTCNTGGTIVICSYDPPGNFNGESPY